MKRPVAYYGVLVTLALIASYLDSLIPLPVPVPGIKLGLANVVTVAVLYLYSGRGAALVSVIRIVLSGFLFGNLFGILYSLSGGFLSLLVMVFLYRSRKFSVVGVSMAGGVFHNLGQLLMAALVLESKDIFYYFPVLFIAGLLTGFLTGLVNQEILKRIPGKEHKE